MSKINFNNRYQTFPSASFRKTLRMPVTNPRALLQIFNKEELQEWMPYLHKALCTWRRIIYKNCLCALKL